MVWLHLLACAVEDLSGSRSKARFPCEKYEQM
jgi:hypothetical protein